MNLKTEFNRFKMMNLEGDSKNRLSKAQYGWLLSSNIRKVAGFYYPCFSVFYLFIDRRLKRHTHANTGQPSGGFRFTFFIAEKHNNCKPQQNRILNKLCFLSVLRKSTFFTNGDEMRNVISKAYPEPTQNLKLYPIPHFTFCIGINSSYGAAKRFLIYAFCMSFHYLALIHNLIPNRLNFHQNYFSFLIKFSGFGIPHSLQSKLDNYMSMYKYQCKYYFVLQFLIFYIGNWFMALEIQKQTITDVDPVQIITSQFHIDRSKRYEVLFSILLLFNQKIEHRGSERFNKLSNIHSGLFQMRSL